MSNEVVSEERLKQLHDVKNERLQLVADAILNERRAGYQEALLADMVMEIKKACMMEG